MGKYCPLAETETWAHQGGTKATKVKVRKEQSARYPFFQRGIDSDTPAFLKNHQNTLDGFPTIITIGYYIDMFWL